MNIGTSYINTLEITFTYQVTGKTTAKNKQLKKTVTQVNKLEKYTFGLIII